MKTGFVFSGGGARIAQLYVMAKAVVEGTYPDPVHPDRHGPAVTPDVIAGTSAGSITAVALNSILAGRYTWDHYRKLLVDLRNSPFSPDARRRRTVFCWLPGNLDKGFVLQTRSRLFPRHLLHATLTDVVENDMGLETLGDLDSRWPVTISTVARQTGKTVRVSSTNPTHQSLRLVDVLMASTAIPIVFPTQPLPGVGPCVDGGTGSDSVPVESMADEDCDVLWLICKQLEDPLADDSLTDDDAPLLEAVPDSGQLDEATADDSAGDYEILTAFRAWAEKLDRTRERGLFVPILDNVLFAVKKFDSDIYTYQIRRARELARTVYLYVPDLDKQFSMIDFNQAKAQIYATGQWVKSNPPEVLEG
jgi:predicted acylesterase/phospholipase RssA